MGTLRAGLNPNTDEWEDFFFLKDDNKLAQSAIVDVSAKYNARGSEVTEKASAKPEVAKGPSWRAGMSAANVV